MQESKEKAVVATTLDLFSRPWETAPYGVVSLLAMLDFAARDFIEISHKFGLLLGEFTKPVTKNPNLLGNSMTDLITHANRLGLNVTVAQLLNLCEELREADSEKVEVALEKEQIKEIRFSGRLENQRMAFHVEAAYNTMLAELGSLVFQVIPRERVQYANPQWLAEMKLGSCFPTSHQELQRAGSCYALGQPTACVFHSMRANEPCLSAMAAHFSLDFSQQNWQALIEQIESKVRALGRQKKSAQKMEDEQFFGAAASQLYFVKNAWRNHVAHTRLTCPPFLVQS